jgi:hypothetical protein
LGEKSVKTLRLSQEARGLLLNDYKGLPRSTEPVSREWEKWLKGTQPTLAVTFEQEAASENPKTVHLSVLHPLVRQAAQFLEIKEPKYCTVAVQSNETIPHGTYHFALYRWTKHGIRRDESLVAVSEDPHLEMSLLTLLQSAVNADTLILPNATECNDLDLRHHQKWAEAQANHIAENQTLVEHRIQSLKVSHRARCKAIEDQIARATNDKIRLMKESELARANFDYDRRMAELQEATKSADIRAIPVVFGTISTKDVSGI